MYHLQFLANSLLLLHQQVSQKHMSGRKELTKVTLFLFKLLFKKPILIIKFQIKLYIFTFVEGMLTFVTEPGKLHTPGKSTKFGLN